MATRGTDLIERPPDDPGIAAMFSRLVEDIERFARAEIRLYRAQLLDRVGRAKSALILGATALFLAQAAMFGLVVGLILILRRPLGPIWATVIVIGGLLIIVAILGAFAVARIKRVTSVKALPDE